MHGHSRSAARPARAATEGRSGARAAAARAAADARAAEPHSGARAAALRSGRDARGRSAATRGDVHTGTLAYEIEHISDHEQRVWLRQAIESGRYRQPLTDDEKRRLLTRLTEVEGMEHYLRRAFLGQKQFSIEGLDVMVPMLDEAIELAAENGAHEVVIGMAHRGRLNVLAHVVGRPYEVILREFEGERTIDAVVSSDEGGTGDVSTTSARRARARRRAATSPSASRRTRATSRRSTRSSRVAHAPSRPIAPCSEGRHDPSVALPVLIHGDASFAGQGGVAETLNLAALAGYSTGGPPPHRRQQPGRLHDRSAARAARRAIRAISRRASTSRSSTSTPTTPRPRSPRSVSRSPTASSFRRRRRRSRRLPAPRAQRAGRGGVHATARGCADREASDRARAVRRPARRGGRRLGRGGRGARRQVLEQLKERAER